MDRLHIVTNPEIVAKCSEWKRLVNTHNNTAANQLLDEIHSLQWSLGLQLKENDNNATA